MKVIVRTPHHESDLQAVPKTSTREIFQTMCKSLGIQETWWFGLMYKGPDNEDVWIDKSKKVSPFFLSNTKVNVFTNSHNAFRSFTLLFTFSIHYA